MPFKFKFKNLRKKKGKKERSAKLIPVDAVHRMFDLYCQEWSTSAIAEDCGVSRRTVTRYVNEGDPSRDLEPFKIRRAKIVGAAMGVQDGRIFKHLHGLQVASSRYLANAGNRYLERIAASQKLDNPALWMDPDGAELRSLRNAAYEPATLDVVNLLDRNMALIELSMRMSGLVPQNNGQTTVNVNVGSSSSSSVDVKTIDAVFDYIDTASKAKAHNGAVVDIVREESLMREEDVGEGKE